MKNHNGDESVPTRSSARKRSSREKSTALELVGNLIQLYKIQGTLLSRLQDQIRRIMT